MPESQGSPPNQAGQGRRAADRVRQRGEAVKQRYAGSSAENLRDRLNSMDFINRGMLFAAILLLCFFPFIIVVNAFAGRTAVDGLARRLGLNREAAALVGRLFASSSATSHAVTGLSYVFFVFGGIAAASAIEDLYERAFDLGHRGGMKNLARQLVWLGVLIGGSQLAALGGPWLRHAGSLLLLGVAGFVVAMAFWWFTMWWLLGGRISWRELLPSAIATAICWIGMQIVFSLIFSNMLISDHREYGDIGVVFALMSWLIAIGVVIILGAVAGVVWRERSLSSSAAGQADAAKASPAER
jgi:membrane protein